MIMTPDPQQQPHSSRQSARRTRPRDFALPFALALAASVLSSCGAAAPPPPPPPAAASAMTGPPVAARRRVVDVYHGVQVTDDYQWLEKADDPEVVAWGAAESAHSRRYLDALPERSALRARLRVLFGTSGADHLALEYRGGRIFRQMEDKPPMQQRFLVAARVGGRSHRRACRRRPERARPQGGTAIDFFVPSLDGRLVRRLALAEGVGERTVHVYDVASGRELDDRIAHVNGGTAGGSVAWNADGSGFYYTRYPRPGERPPADLDFYQQVYFHKLGTPEKDDRYALGKELPRIAETKLSSPATTASTCSRRSRTATVARSRTGCSCLVARGR